MNKQIDGIDKQAMDLLQNFSWSGNVRELENAIERAMVVAKQNNLKFNDFLLNNANETPEFSTGLSLDAVEKNHILNVLNKNNWNISSSAQILGIDRVTIYKKLQKYGIKRPTNA